MTFENLDLVVVEGDLLFDAAVSGKDKAVAIKAQLRIEKDRPLMEELGRMGMVCHSSYQRDRR